jgi:hypothetical protein
MGAAPFPPFYSTPFEKMSGEPWDSLRMADQFDALLYLGPPEAITLAPVSRARCGNARYMAMRLARMALVPWGQPQIARLKDACAAAVR